MCEQARQSDCVKCAGEVVMRFYTAREGLVLKCKQCDARTRIPYAHASHWINLHPWDSDVVAVSEAAVGDYYTDLYFNRNERDREAA